MAYYVEYYDDESMKVENGKVYLRQFKIKDKPSSGLGDWVEDPDRYWDGECLPNGTKIIKSRKAK